MPQRLQHSKAHDFQSDFDESMFLFPDIFAKHVNSDATVCAAPTAYPSLRSHP